jgi:hypothetical protein
MKQRKTKIRSWWFAPTSAVVIAYMPASHPHMGADICVLDITGQHLKLSASLLGA